MSMEDKLQLAALPTPLSKMPGLSEEWGVNLWIKRDDYSGSEISGNKIRKLEYSLRECITQGYDSVITSGAIQSNHCRATAAACAYLGLPCTLVLSSATPPDLTQVEGNTFFALALGAEVHVVASSAERGAKIEDLRQQGLREGKKPYIIPVGASNATGSQGYRGCFREILAQEEAKGVTFDLLALAVGSGGTYAGLAFENALQDKPKDILGFSVSDSAATFQASIAEILDTMWQREADSNPSAPLPNLAGMQEKILINDQYIGDGYAIAQAEELAFILEVARKSGVIFDPCYSGKAFRGLATEIRQGKLAKYKNILFIHTGGLLGWTAHNRAMASQFLREQWQQGPSC